MPDQPNVLFVISDQHNARVLGCQGHPDVQTPHLDKLAGQGTWLANAIPQSPICTPSRVCYFSGQYCHNHGYYGLDGPNPGGLPTVLGHFRRAGYRTGAFGKIHCPEYWVEDDCDGFADSANCSILGSEEYETYLAEQGMTDHFDAKRLQEQSGKAQALDARASRLPYEHTPEAWAARKGMEFMTSARDEDRPFFIQVSLERPHQIYTPSEPFWSMYEGKDLQLPPNTGYDLRAAHKAPHLIQMADRFRTGDWTIFEPRSFEAGRMRKLRGYLGCVSQVDHAVGELMGFLDDAGLAENTIVIYAADHGEYVCQHDIMEKAPGICSDAVCHVPMIWRWPGKIAEGRSADELVEAIDLVPTICRLAGVDALQTADGKDISHILAGQAGEVRELAVTENPWSKSVRKGPWRYVHYPREMFAEEYPDGFGELYHLDDDPWEMSNLYFDDRYQETVCQLQRDLADWLITTTRPTTILPHARFDGPQAHLRYRNSVNADNRIHPDHVRSRTMNHYI